MRQSKRIVLFLLLNVVVSACTILAVLWLWDPGNRPALLKPSEPTKVVVPGINPPEVSITEVPATPMPTEVKDIPKGLIAIENVIGSGSVASEVIILKRKGSDELKLTNWKLQDENGNTYIFPDLTLYEGGGVFVHSTVGVNTVIDLFWNQNEPIWQQGETVTLIDYLGNIQATYLIP